MSEHSKQQHRSNRLRWFLSIAVALSIVLPALLVGIVQIGLRLQSDISEASERQAQALMEVLKEGLNPPLWAFNKENAQHLIDGVFLNDAVNRIIVLDSIGSEFVKQERPGQNLSASDTITLQADVFRGGEDEDPESIGSVLLEYSLEPARLDAWQDAREVLSITGVQVLISLSVILLILNQRVTAPLARIKNFAHEIAGKNFDASIHSRYDDEFSELAIELDSMKHALKESFEHLEDRVKQRTQDLTLVNQELTDTVQRLEEAKDSLVETEKLAALGSLVAGVSHELNTPIGNGRVMSSSLHETAKHLQEAFESQTMTRSQFENGIDEILQGASLIERNLLKAINLVQSFKKIAVDRTSDNRRVFLLNEFIHEIESTMHHIFKSNPYSLDVKLGEDIELNSYPGVLSQVISNLINNAIMHGLENQPSGTVTVTTRPYASRVSIIVQDDGLGMSEEVKKRIFEPFFTTKMGKGGSGLGMHIVHNLTTASLGGRLSVESNVGNGTSVTIDIPLEAPESVLSTNSVSEETGL
jgi:signal transduction histidine kinase